jgi:hypothetical protein
MPKKHHPGFPPVGCVQEGQVIKEAPLAGSILKNTAAAADQEISRLQQICYLGYIPPGDPFFTKFRARPGISG